MVRTKCVGTSALRQAELIVCDDVADLIAEVVVFGAEGVGCREQVARECQCCHDGGHQEVKCLDRFAIDRLGCFYGANGIVE